MQSLSLHPFDPQVSALEVKLKEKCTVDYQVKIFPGQTHGFVHRKREDINPEDKPCIQEARADMLSWFNKYMWMGKFDQSSVFPGPTPFWCRLQKLYVKNN